MSGQISDQQLVELLRQWDKNAFNLLLQKYQNKAMSLLSRYVCNHADVWDVAQEDFIKAYLALPNFRGESAFYIWLYSIAVNTTKNHLVAHGRRAAVNDIDSEEDEYYDGSYALKEFVSPELLMMSDQIQKVVFDTLDTLPEELKMAISLCELNNISYEEIANVIDCQVGTVRSCIFRDREAIDKKLQPLLEQ